MAQPRVKFGMRPKKTGAKKRQRVKTQKKRLITAGLDAAKVEKMTEKEIRQQLRKAYKRKKI